MSTEYYQDYFWKSGAPYGTLPTSPLSNLPTYKIVTDPYRKRISIEEYLQGKFQRIIYDSALLDFRKLTPIDQVAWEKELIKEGAATAECLIRDQNGRIVWKENYQFEREYCRKCEIYSPHGILVGIQHMCYTTLGDKYNGLTLYDVNGHQVMFKSYEIDEENQLFTTVLSEVWDFSHN